MPFRAPPTAALGAAFAHTHGGFCLNAPTLEVGMAPRTRLISPVPTRLVPAACRHPNAPTP